MNTVRELNNEEIRQVAGGVDVIEPVPLSQLPGELIDSTTSIATNVVTGAVSLVNILLSSTQKLVSSLVSLPTGIGGES